MILGKEARERAKVLLQQMDGIIEEIMYLHPELQTVIISTVTKRRGREKRVNGKAYDRRDFKILEKKNGKQK